MNINEVAQMIGGTVDGLVPHEITGVNSIDKAGAGDVVFAMDEERLGLAEHSKAACILAPVSIRPSTKPLVRVKDPKMGFVILYNVFTRTEAVKASVDASARIAPSAHIGTNVWIGPYVVIEEDVAIGNNVVIESGTVIKKNCSIGNGCHLYPRVTLYPYTVIKNKVIVHAGAVLGADGFGYVRQGADVYKFPQIGQVIIDDNVEIGANTTIDRGALGNTTIGMNTKIDNQCQIAHNVTIGKNVLMAAHGGVAGSCVIKDNVSLGGQVGIADNITIGAGAMIGAQAGIIGDIDAGAVVWGTPARPIAQVKRQMAVLARLTKHFHQLKDMFQD